MGDRPTNETTSLRRSGGCLCGAVRYTVTGEPINVRICHCHRCQKATGSAFFARALFAKGAVTIEGSPAEIRSSADLMRRFCPQCGSHLFSERISNPHALAVTLGSLDDPDSFAPTEHIWTSRKVAWLVLADNLPQHPEMPS
ncbi:GFA family protein [Dyella tabacisoli]|uniref:GFA family protein n=1 Tax=Dyella tabacisoli TaxID=2282381 RepID=A0A369UR54_9GAMM|nr:GFA family protein [Dyella tabacisoli]RDD82218.1 GFA family protein [Dyella tabacisoli]